MLIIFVQVATRCCKHAAAAAAAVDCQPEPERRKRRKLLLRPAPPHDTTRTDHNTTVDQRGTDVNLLGTTKKEPRRDSAENVDAASVCC